MATVGLQTLKRALTVKRAYAKMLESKLTSESINASRSDWHARRLPRPCGLTVHTCIGCPFYCTYCYIDDLGFAHGEAHPYALKAEEWIYAVLSNPSFLPGNLGTYLAFGSVCEPLHGKCGERTISYLEQVVKLGNPCQVATKAVIDEELAEKLSKVGGGLLNVLVTIVTLKHHEKLEPRTPSPLDRIEALKNLRKAGVPTFIFLRPLIPGINIEEVEEIVVEGKQAGAVGVVLGGFRVSKRILERLEKAGVNTSEIKRRIPKRWEGRRLIDIVVADLKREATKVVEEKGLIPLQSACCATTLSYMLSKGERIPCAGLCYIDRRNCYAKCPVRCRELLSKLDEEEAVEALKLLGAIPLEVKIEDLIVKARVRGAKTCRVVNLFNTSFRRRLMVK